MWPDRTISTAEMGRRLGVSKNAVVGKAARIGLPSRGSPIQYRAAAVPAPAVQRRAAPAGPVTLPPLPSLAEV